MKTDKKTVIKEYTKKNGQKSFYFNVYGGIDELTGKQRNIMRRGFNSVSEAKAALKKVQSDIANGKYNKNIIQKKNFKAIYELWLPNYKKTVKESTYASTVMIFNKHILPKFERYLIDKIDVTMCQKVINNWSDERPKLYKKYKNYASKVFHYAMTLDLINHNPMDKVTMPIRKAMIGEVKQINFYEKEELVEFLKYAKEYDEMYYAFFRLLAFTGLRKGEALALEWNDIDVFNRTINVNKTVTRGEKGRVFVDTPKTKNSIRKISVDKGTLDVLLEYKHKSKIVSINNKLIFTNSLDKLIMPTNTGKWIKKICKKIISKKLQHMNLGIPMHHYYLHQDCQSKRYKKD